MEDKANNVILFQNSLSNKFGRDKIKNYMNNSDILVVFGRHQMWMNKSRTIKEILSQFWIKVIYLPSLRYLY